jgi:CRP-like cAMP-binding protein
MSHEDDFMITLFKEISIFSTLGSQSLHCLYSKFSEKIYAQGEIIFTEGTGGDSMMVLASGEVRVSYVTSPGEEEALIILKKGDLLGEMALLESQPRSATAIAHTPVILLEISQKDFLDFIEKDPTAGVPILLHLSRMLSSRLRETDQKLRAFISLTKWI